MRKYLSSIIADFPEQITAVSATPAVDHLFKVREDGKKLSEEQADAFHHTVYQLSDSGVLINYASTSPR